MIYFLSYCAFQNLHMMIFSTLDEKFSQNLEKKKMKRQILGFGNDETPLHGIRWTVNSFFRIFFAYFRICFLCLRKGFLHIFVCYDFFSLVRKICWSSGWWTHIVGTKVVFYQVSKDSFFSSSCSAKSEERLLIVGAPSPFPFGIVKYLSKAPLHQKIWSSKLQNIWKEFHSRSFLCFGLCYCTFHQPKCEHLAFKIWSSFLMYILKEIKKHFFRFSPIILLSSKSLFKPFQAFFTSLCMVWCKQKATGKKIQFTFKE